MNYDLHSEFFAELETACPVTKVYREAGYRWHKSTGSMLQRFDALLQKPIYRDGVRAFWINVSVWGNRPYGKNHIGLDSDSQFELKDGRTVDVKLHDVSDNPEVTEAFYAKFFDLFDCKNYDD